MRPFKQKQQEQEQDQEPEQKPDKEYYSAGERAGFNFGNSIYFMLEKLEINDGDVIDFMRGLNRSLYRRLKQMEQGE